MVRLKKHYKIVLVVLVSLVLSFAAFWYYDYQRDIRSRLIHILPVDINQDGVDELIRIYGTSDRVKNRTLSSVEAYDQKNDRVLWRQKTPRALYIYEFQKLTVSSGHILIFAIETQNGFALQALNLTTGKHIWTFIPPGGNTNFKPRPTIHTRLQIFKNKLYLTYQFNIETSTLLILNIQTGTQLQNQKLRKYAVPHNLIIYENHLLLGLDKELHLLNSKGESRAVFQATLPWKYDNKLLVLSGQEGLMELDLTKQRFKSPTHFSGKPLKRKSHTLQLGLYRGHLLQSSWNKSSATTSLIATSLKTGVSRKFAELPEGYRIQAKNLNGIKNWNLDACPYHTIPERFLPIFASASEGDKEILKIFVLDLDKQRISWESKGFIGFDVTLSNKVIFSAAGYYFLELSLNKSDKAPVAFARNQEQRSLLILEGKSGKFKEPLNFGEGKLMSALILEPAHRPAWISNHIVYGRAQQEAQYWHYDLRSMRPAFPNSDAKQLPSARKLVEAKLGFLPRAAPLSRIK